MLRNPSSVFIRGIKDNLFVSIFEVESHKSTDFTVTILTGGYDHAKQSSESKKQIKQVYMCTFEAEQSAGESARMKISSMKEHGFIISTSGGRTAFI